ncbi:MAG TPA: hypothetical protein VN861_08980 [Candidatus Acidoferrales bacterium]|nr:hypothetical protein [Candidatus Acidoferrales bacterium]
MNSTRLFGTLSITQSILIARKLVDDLIYSEKGDEVLLVKYLGVEPLQH